MNAIRTVLAGCLLLGLSVMSLAAKADDPKKAAIDKDKLVGKWECVKTEDVLSQGMVLEFTKDGKLKRWLDNLVVPGGSYKVDGDKLNLTILPIPGEKDRKRALVIKMLTDTKLIVEDKKGKEEWQKKK
jgi:uncharacterized protein (TIGR03066 family)